MPNVGNPRGQPRKQKLRSILMQARKTKQLLNAAKRRGQNKSKAAISH